MKSVFRRRASGKDRGTRLFAAYMVIVFAVAMTAQGLAAPPNKAEKPGKQKTEVAEPVVSEPAQSEPAPAEQPKANAPAAPPVVQEAPADQSPAVVSAAAPAVTASAIAPSASVTPVFMPGNPALGDGGIKIEPPASGTYHYDDAKEVNEPGVPHDFELVITVAGDGKTFSFTCNYKITQVIVKGGPDAYAYNYPGGTYGDSGLVSPTGDNGSVPGLSHINFYFGPETPQVHIFATKFHDDGAAADFANGIRNGGAEEWLGGFRFDLYTGPDSDGPWTFVESATSVLANGQADFGMHPFGWYKIVEVLSPDQIAAGWYCTTSGGVKVFQTTGEYNAGLWFGNVQDPEEETGDLEVYKFLDDDEDGLWDELDADETMLSGWAFTLYTNAGAPVGSGTTDASGKLLFSDLVPGAYYVTETLTPGWHNTTALTQHVTVVANTSASTLGAACIEPPEPVVAALWFGNAPDEGDLIVYKYLDENENGEYDTGEEMLEDWDFTVTRESAPIGPVFVDPSAIGFVRMGSTDADGELLLTQLAAGEYAVTETLQDGWFNTTALKQFVEVEDGQTAEVWFGNHPDPEDPELGDLVIHKYYDENENGEYDAGEEMLDGWDFTVVNLAGPILPDVISPAVALIGSGQTGADGTLSFTDLNPGTVSITETLQDGWKSTTGLTEEVQIVAGQTTHVWFGNIEDFLRFTELDLAITKVADDHTVDEGQLVTYTLTWWNLMAEEDAIDYTIVDDYDERYLTIVNANGGVVANGKITWTFAGPLSAAMGKQTLSYTARVIADMPNAVTNIDNVVVIDDDRDFNYTNNRDDKRVVYRPETSDDPYLPFTGGEYLMLLIAAATAVSVGLVLRMQPGKSS